MISSRLFRGTGVALITPFNGDGSVDYVALKKLVQYVLSNGIDFLVVQGTTAETATLSEDEKTTILQTIIEVNNKHIPLVFGLGGNNTSAMVHQLKTSSFVGVDALLVATPYYNKPNQAGLYEHYKTLATNSPLPIILYNVPSRTACNMDATTTIRLAREFDAIIAVKEASGNYAQIMDLIKNKPEHFLVLSGDDATTFPLVALGGDGVISVIANALPSEFSEMTRKALRGEWDVARKLHYRFIDLLKSIFEEGNPAGVKAILSLQGKIQNQLRLPLVPVSIALYERIKDQLNKF